MNYYPGLNSLRGLAALCVIPSHIEQIKKHAGMPYDHWFPIPGIYGVILFFALSGFLITSILLSERQLTGKIDFKKFYIKRALRIWPLYFLLYALSLLVFNRIDALAFFPNSEKAIEMLDLKSLILIVAIFPNFLASGIPYAAHSWSIGVEEQFYLFQPAIISLAKKTFLVMISLTGIILSPEWLAKLAYFFDSHLLYMITGQAKYFSCIAIGGFTACLNICCRDTIDRLIHNRITPIILMLTFGGLMAFEHHLGPGNRGIVDFRIYAALFSAIILLVGTSKRRLWLHHNRALNYIGEISYGIYMFHPMCIGISLLLINSSPATDPLANILLYLLCIGLTLVTSDISYKYFEGYFRKKRQSLS